MPQKTKAPPSLPLSWLARAARRSRTIRLIANHAHLLRILEDHQYELAICQTDEERHQVCAECRRQVVLALTGVAGMDTALHGGGMLAFGHVEFGMLLLVMGAALAWIAMRLGGP